MIAFSISKFIGFLNEIYMNDVDKNSISARELYLKYLNCDDATSKALCNNPLIFKCLLEILSKRNIISISSDNNRININKLNYIDYNMHREYDNDVIEMENYDYNADYIDGNCIIDYSEMYKYDYENNICYINGDICGSNDLKKDVYSYFYYRYVFVDENNLNATKLNLTYQIEFDKTFYIESSNERPKFLVSFEYCFVKIKEQIGKKLGYINRDFIYYDDDKYLYYLFKSYLKQIKYADYIEFFRSVSEDIVIEGDNYNEDICIKKLIPSIWEIDQFLQSIDESNLDNINIDKLIKSFKKYSDNIHEFIEYPYDEIPYVDVVGLELEEYIEENIDEYFYSNFTYENIDYYLDFEKVNEPEELERLEYDSKEIMKSKALRKEAIKRFCEKPFGKEYSDLSEDELLKYEKVIKKLKKYLR